MEDNGMRSLLHKTARKIKIGKKYKLPNLYAVNEDGNHPVISCECIGKYGTYAAFRTPKGTVMTYSYFDLSTGIAYEYRRSVSYVNSKNSEFVVSLV